MVIARGEIWWVNLGAVSGSAPTKRRPVVVIQADGFNGSSIATVIVAVITSKTQAAEIPGNVFVPATASGLPRDSAINVSQIVTVERERLTGRVGRLPGYVLGELDGGLRRVLHL